MKDLKKVFDDAFQAIQKLLDDLQFSNCFTYSTYLTRLSALSDFEDGLFVGEIFENVFEQIDDLYSDYEIEENEISRIQKDLKTHLSLVQDAFQQNNHEKLYTSLRDLRAVTTMFQFKCWTMMKQKSAKDFRRRILTRE